MKQWIDATRLHEGDWLRTSAGTHVQVTALKRWTQHATVHNLTVTDLHTYYVLAGKVPVLVHNSACAKYENPGHHCPSGGPNPYNPEKGVLPADAEGQFANSVQVGKVRWTKIGSGKTAVYYRYSDNGHGQWHWSGSSNGVTKSGVPARIPEDDIPISVRRR